MLRCAIALVLIAVSISDSTAGPLHDAASRGDAEKVLSLVDAGADLDVPGEYGETPLTSALIGGHIDVAALLIERGASVDGRNRGGFTPLHAAAYVGAAAIAGKLLDLGADVNDQMNKARVTALSIASEEGHAAVAKVLIDRGANLEAAEQNGYTPLTRAIWRRQEEMIALLQQSGAKCQPVEILEEPAFSQCMAGQK